MCQPKAELAHAATDVEASQMEAAHPLGLRFQQARHFGAKRVGPVGRPGRSVEQNHAHDYACSGRMVLEIECERLALAHAIADPQHEECGQPAKDVQLARRDVARGVIERDAHAAIH